MSLRISIRPRGFTLLECVMAMVSVGAVGLAIFYTLFSGMLLFTKNTAMNVSHEEARVALIQLQNDLHTAVSLPEMTDSTGTLISGTGPAAGVEFQVLIDPSQYCSVTANVTSTNSTSITIGLPSGYPTPDTSMLLIVPAYSLQQSLSAVTVSGTIATCTLSSAIGTTVTVSGSGNNYNVIAFFTQRVYYYVTGAQVPGYQSGSLVLNYIGLNKTHSYAMASNDILSQTPFSIPPNDEGAPNYHDVVAVGLSAEDPNTSALATRFKFNTSSIMLSGSIPAYSSPLTSFQ